MELELFTARFLPSALTRIPQNVDFISGSRAAAGPTARPRSPRPEELFERYSPSLGRGLLPVVAPPARSSPTPPTARAAPRAPPVSSRSGHVSDVDTAAAS